jgi:hypothetical protein
MIIALLFSTTASAESNAYSNDLIIVGDLHNECLQSFGETYGGWENLGSWPTVTFEEVYVKTVDCVVEHLQDNALTAEFVYELFPADDVYCAINASQSYADPAVSSAMSELDSAIEEHVTRLIIDQESRDIVLEELGYTLQAIDDGYDLSEESQLAYGAAAAIGFRSFEFWTDSARLEALLASAESDSDDDGGDDDGGGDDGGGDDGGISGFVKKVANVVKADAEGGAWGAASGAAIGGLMGGAMGAGGFITGPGGVVTAAGGAMGGATIGRGVGAILVGSISSIDEGMNGDNGEPGEIEGEGGDLPLDEGSCPDDSFPGDR